MKVEAPLESRELRTDRIEYKLQCHMPGGSLSFDLILRGMFEQDLEREATALFKLLVENGWMSNEIMSRTAFYDHHKTYIAKHDEKKPPS